MDYLVMGINRMGQLKKLKGAWRKARLQNSQVKKVIRKKLSR